MQILGVCVLLVDFNSSKWTAGSSLEASLPIGPQKASLHTISSDLSSSKATFYLTNGRSVTVLVTIQPLTG